MPNFDMGETLDIDKGGIFIKLKSKGDKVKFRLIKGGYYDGKHFIKDGDNWVISYCPRIMNKLPCSYCEKYFNLIAEAKQLEDKNEKEKMMKNARNYQPKITFYYPIIDRESGKGRILKTTMSVRLELETEFKDGIDVYEYDYILTRTEESPAKYYKLTRLDSKDCIDLTEDEVEEMFKLGSMDLAELCGGKESTETFGKEEKEEKEEKKEKKPKEEQMPF